MKIMVWALVIGLAFAAHAWGQANLFTINGSVITGAALPLSGTLEIPAVVNGVPITEIAPNAFGGPYFNTKFFPGITNLIIPACVTNLGGNAFSGCSNLQGTYFLGNAPTNWQGAFQSEYIANPSALYYLNGTTGWGYIYTDKHGVKWAGGHAFFPWQPSIQLLATNSASLTVNWARGQTVVIEASDSPAGSAWVPVYTNTIPDAPLLTNCLPAAEISFTDPDQTNHASRFYRVRSAN